MIYNLEKPTDREKFNKRIPGLLEGEKIVELREVRRRRTLDQNSYLHVLFTIWAVEYGYTMQEAKTLIKRRCPFMVYEKNGDKFVKQTSKMDTGELTEFIDWFRSWSSQNGLYLPTPEEYYQEQYFYHNLGEQNKEFL